MLTRSTPRQNRRICDWRSSLRIRPSLIPSYKPFGEATLTTSIAPPVNSSGARSRPATRKEPRLHDLQLDFIRAQFPDRESLELSHETMRLSAHVIQSDPQQFASQMLGRLNPFCASPQIQNFLDEIAIGAAKPWLRPIHPGPRLPGTGLFRTFGGHSGEFFDVAATPDRTRAISASRDPTLKVWDLQSGRALRSLAGHSHPVTSVAVPPRGHAPSPPPGPNAEGPGSAERRVCRYIYLRCRHLMLCLRSRSYRRGRGRWSGTFPAAGETRLEDRRSLLIVVPRLCRFSLRNVCENLATSKTLLKNLCLLSLYPVTSR